MNKHIHVGILVVGLVLGCASHAEGYVDGNFQLKAPLDEPKLFCFDIVGFGPKVVLTEALSVRPCKNRVWKDSAFTVHYPEQGQIYSPDYDHSLNTTLLRSISNDQ